MDMISYLLGNVSGKKQGKEEGTKHVVLESSDYTFTDTNTNGNIRIEKKE